MANNSSHIKLEPTEFASEYSIPGQATIPSGRITLLYYQGESGFGTQAEWTVNGLAGAVFTSHYYAIYICRNSSWENYTSGVTGPCRKESFNADFNGSFHAWTGFVSTTESANYYIWVAEERDDGRNYDYTLDRNKVVLTGSIFLDP